jgi:signal transduction histidine kinase
VYVKDSGIGMTDVESVRIFDRFYRADSSRTRSISGTGLGMSIVVSIVSLHKGKVWIENTSQEGTTIIVELPIKTI